ncbi:uncharacterized protein LOC135822385 [Sycon ciliatum]|uniref:uncharacterized protein LOC135822385 n=1 Tax=Sycon ciliatum TaxID=27933 RepID=UPI0031F5F11E|eukprot:scpid71664/ scgid15613/ GRB2-associated-binding protein 2; GRB2-associated binder 2; Growth factor receptor bound protein 2-associated protein 2
MTEVIKQGYLVKSPPLSETGSTTMKGWKRRWFILRNDHGKYSLQYFESEGSAAGGQQPKGTILLQDCTCVHSDMKHNKHRNVFGVAIPTRTYYMAAESQMEMDEWTALLCRILGFAKGQMMTLARSTAADAISPVMAVDDSRATFAKSRSASTATMPVAAPRGTLQRTKSEVSSFSTSLPVPIAAGTGASTLRRTSTDSSLSPPSEQVCLVNREVIVKVEKRFAMRSIAFVDAMDGVWIGGWNHNVPALSGLFKFGDQVLRVGGQPVVSAEAANRAIDCFTGGGEMDILLLRTPWAMEVEIQRRSRSEPLGVSLKENKITSVKSNGAAAQCGMSEQAVGLTGDLVSWIISEVNGRPVSLTPRHKDDTYKLLHATGMTVQLLLQPEDFVKLLFKKLKSTYKQYSAFIPG